MIYQLFTFTDTDSLLLTGAAAFILTLLGICLFSRYLPKDQGRKFAVNGALSQGKPRGAGLILLLVYIIAGILFIPLSPEYIIYLAALFLEMLSGYLDDASEKPWGELKKGIIDLAVSVGVSVTVYLYHGSEVVLPLLHMSFVIPAPVYVLLGIVLIWASINVTNCADGVDGLCASLSIVTLGTVFCLLMTQALTGMGYMVWMMIFVLLAYLWFNCAPSRLLMGDAGSRSIGLLIAIAFMVSGQPFLYLPAALLLLLDGGLGLLKLTVLRVLKIKGFMQNIRTPLHDHARKNHGWSDTQVVTRFTLIQLLLSMAVLLLTKSF